MEFSKLELMFMFLLSCTTFGMYYYFIQRRSHVAALPPSPPFKLPIMGHLHHLLTTDMPHHTFADLATKLGPIFYLQLGRVPTVVISSSRLAELVLKTYDHVFSNSPQLIGAQYLSFGYSDVTFGPYWCQARKICVTELLSSVQVNSFQIIRNEEVNRMLQTVSTQSNSEVDMRDLFFQLANDVLCRVAFGKRFKRGGMKNDLIEVFTEAQVLLAGFCLGDFFPDWEWVNSVTGMKKRLMKNLNDLRAVCDEIITEHMNMEGKEKNNEDFLDVLLRVQKRSDLEVPITDDNLKSLVLDMFIAGTDTTSSTLEWTLTELAIHPKILKRAQQEVRIIAAEKGVVDETDLKHLVYLRAVIKEAMRLHPPVPLLVPRESMEGCILDGYEILPKTRVLINTYAIGRDAMSWEKPLEYNPDRFLGNNDDTDFKGRDFRFLPFGGGRRGCPGYSFGLASVEITLARLLFHFDWRLPLGQGADDVDLSEIFGLATRKKSALRLIPIISLDHPLQNNVTQS